MKAELALDSFDPATPTPSPTLTHPYSPPTRESLITIIFQWKLTKQPYRSPVGPKLEDDTHFWANGGRPQLLSRWKTNLIFGQMDYDLNFSGEWKTTIIKFSFIFFRQMEDDHNFLGKWKTTSTFL